MLTDLLWLTILLSTIFVVSVSLLIWDTQRQFKLELAKVREEYRNEL
jgi:hypothetical protein